MVNPISYSIKMAATKMAATEEGPVEKSKYVFDRLNKNQENIVARIILAIRGFFREGKTGSAQHLSHHTKELLKDPTNQMKLEAFYSAFKARVEKVIGFDLSKEEVTFKKECIEKALTNEGKNVEKFDGVKADLLKRIAFIEADAFVESQKQPTVKLDTVEAAVETKSVELAALAGLADAEKSDFEAYLAKGLLGALGSDLTQIKSGQPQDVKERFEIEKQKFDQLKADYAAFRSEYTRFISEYNLTKPLLKKAVAEKAENYKKAELSLNIQLSELRAALAQLMKNGASANVDCSSQAKLLKDLSDLTQEAVLNRNPQSVRKLVLKLSNLSEFLASKAVSKNLKADQKIVMSQVTALQEFLYIDFKRSGEFQTAAADLAKAEGDLASLNSELKSREAKDAEYDAKVHKQRQLLQDQELLDEVASRNALATEAYKKALEARTQAPLLSMASIPGTGPKAPVLEEQPFTKTGGIRSLVRAEHSENQEVAARLYSYLSDKSSPVQKNVPVKKGIIQRSLHSVKNACVSILEAANEINFGAQG